MLHISVHSNYYITICMVKSAGQGKLMTAVSCQEHRLYPLILFFKLTKNYTAVVLRTVINKNKLKGIICQGLHSLAYGFIKMPQIRFFIINRYNNRN